MTAAYQRTWETRRGGRSAGDEARESYYGIPAIHKPHWNWLVIVYFFVGGISGASYTIASYADLLGGKGNRQIARVGRYLSLLALMPSPILLILDLGRPERFLYMLRVLKLRSPMSVGSWALTVFGVFCTTSALIQAARDGLLGRSNSLSNRLRALPARPIGLLGTAPAFLVAGYTGVLLAVTAVPLWTRSHLLMGPLFLSSAMSNATAAIALILALSRGTQHRTLLRLERLDLLALLAELGLLIATYLRLGRTLARPLTGGRLGLLNAVGVLGAGLALPIVLLGRVALGRTEPSRLGSVLTSALVLAGGFAFRYVMIVAGRASADDPSATFELARGA